MATFEFNYDDRVIHPTLGKGSYRGRAYLDDMPMKAWVLFDDHDGGNWIAVSRQSLLPLSPPPKPQPYLELRGDGLTLIDHYLNHGNTWLPFSKKNWRRTLGGSSRRFIYLSEIEEGSEDE